MPSAAIRRTATYVTNIVEGMQLGRQATVNAEELFVHDSGKGQSAEGLHARVVDTLRVLALAYKGR